jgi:predicted negative regulator of RcsB-dependent stress response
MKIGISFGLFLLLSLAAFFGHRHFNKQDSDQITHAQYAKQIEPPPALESYGPPEPPPK